LGEGSLSHLITTIHWRGELEAETTERHV